MEGTLADLDLVFEASICLRLLPLKQLWVFVALNIVSTGSILLAVLPRNLKDLIFVLALHL